ncbi:hypothetical protein Pfo_007959 [Paulownia fortunei]|nr:hypothetical protein Pfo_007959 [Paulownia fortunei]
MAYMLKGETEFDALKCIFQEETSSKSGPDDNEIIEISSDHDGDGSTVQVRNELKKIHDEVGLGRPPSTESPSSSTASNSPWKKFRNADNEEGADDGAHEENIDDEQLNEKVSGDEVPRDDEAGLDDEISSGVEDGSGVEN